MEAKFSNAFDFFFAPHNGVELVVFCQASEITAEVIENGSSGFLCTFLLAFAAGCAGT